MAVVKISAYSISDVNFEALMDTTDDQRYGYHQVNLTEMATTTVPKVSDGSIFENNGALYQVNSDMTIGGSPADGKVFIYFDVSALAFTFTNTAPTWDDDKQGFYGTGGNANDRYLLFMMTLSGGGSLWNNKRRIIINNETDAITLEDGVDGDKSLYFASDARIIWDESEDEFVINKPLNAGSSKIETTGTVFTDDIVATGNIDGLLVSGTQVVSVALRAIGDTGGSASATTLTDVTASTTAGTGLVASGNNDAAGFIKMYVGTTAVYVPYWTAIT